MRKISMSALVSLLLMGTSSFAAESYRSAGGERTMIYQGEGHWFVDRVQTAPDGWPETLSHESYDTRAEIFYRKGQPIPPAQELFSDGPGVHGAELHGRAQYVDARGLWVVTQQWSPAWEARYSDWIAKNLTSDFFVKANFATACSDVEYALRWIFARNNGLPAANRLITGEWFTSRSLRDSWRRLPTGGAWFEDKRFLAALNYLTHHTYTHTLWSDSYPIAIGPGSLVPGVYHLNRDQLTGHTMILTQVSSDPDQVPIETLSSTTPRQIRELNLFMYAEKQADPQHLGLMKMRWPDLTGARVRLVPAEQMPDYSTEQFAPNFVKAPYQFFWEEIFARINPNLNADAIAMAMRDQIRQMFLVRAPLVERGFAACGARPSACRQGSSGWEDWSTVARDQRLGNAIEVFDKFLARAHDANSITAHFDEVLVTIEGEAMSFDRLLKIFRLRTYSVIPSDSLKRRWGIIPGPVQNY